MISTSRPGNAVEDAMKISRRDLLKASVPAIGLLKLNVAAKSSFIDGVQLGCQTYSFHDITAGGPQAIDQIVQHMNQVGLDMCELFSPDLEPFPMPWFSVEPWAPKAAKGGGPAGDVTAAVAMARVKAGSPEAKAQREQLRKWRLSVPLDYFQSISKKFRDAGIKLHCFNLSFDDSFSDEEINKGFEMAKALGTNIITASTTLSVAKRLAPFAENHRTYVSMHGHSSVKDPNQFSSPATFATALAWSKYFKINLDIGHFWAAGFDPVAFIREQHANITNLHLKDRLTNDGPNVAWAEGPGHTPIRAVLQLLEKNRWPIPAFIEYEYQGPGTPTEEVAKSYAIAQKYLQG
jgi:sugar phosphate isomerase/epimerase